MFITARRNIRRENYVYSDKINMSRNGHIFSEVKCQKVFKYKSYLFVYPLLKPEQWQAKLFMSFITLLRSFNFYCTV